jgi:hypothetical protein
MSTIVSVWAGICLAGVLALVAAAGRLGRDRAAAWLVVVGIVVLTLEEPAITLWLAVAGPASDPDGMAGSVTPMARVHVLDAGLFAIAAAGLFGWVALSALRRGERWARRLLGWGLVVVTVTEVGGAVLVFSRGLPLPGPGGAAGQAGFGWQPVVVGLLAWATGVWFAHRTRATGSVAQAPSADTAVGTGV